eukprot:scaffold113908_cov44-Phaeocystis_antarctica.AAC.1
MLNSLLRREQGRMHRSTAIKRVLVEDFAGDEEHGRYEIGEHAAPYSNGVPPFAISFCPHAGQGHWAAVADEEGRLTLLNTSKSALEQPCECRAHHPRSCHHTCACRPSLGLPAASPSSMWTVPLHAPPPCAPPTHPTLTPPHAPPPPSRISTLRLRSPHAHRLVARAPQRALRLGVDAARQPHRHRLGRPD